MIAPPNLEPISQLLKVDVAEYQELVYCSVSSAVLLWTADIKGLRKNKLYNLTALREERVVPVGMESGWLEMEFLHF